MRPLVLLLAAGCAIDAQSANPNPTAHVPAPAPSAVPQPAPRLSDWRGDRLAVLASEGDTLVSPIIERRFRQAIVSWDAVTPAGASIEVDLRVRIAGSWTHDYVMGLWSSDPAFHSHSVAGQVDASARVDTDTLITAADADAFQARVRLVGAAQLRGLAVLATHPDDRTPAIAVRPTSAIDVPTRSQMIYPNGGEVWCSPTSTSMLLAYWGYVESVPTAAAGCLDPVYGGTGNWPFNMAHAATIGGGSLRAVVTRLHDIDQLQALVGAGFPVAISASWARGGMPGSPLDSTDGHLLVVRGFDTSGNVLVNDPAGPSDDAVRYTYPRAALDAAWATSGRTIYLIHPLDRPPPQDYAFGSW